MSSSEWADVFQKGVFLKVFLTRVNLIISCRSCVWWISPEFMTTCKWMEEDKNPMTLWLLRLEALQFYSEGFIELLYTIKWLEIWFVKLNMILLMGHSRSLRILNTSAINANHVSINKCWNLKGFWNGFTCDYRWEQTWRQVLQRPTSSRQEKVYFFLHIEFLVFESMQYWRYEKGNDHYWC